MRLHKTELNGRRAFIELLGKRRDLGNERNPDRRLWDSINGHVDQSLKQYRANELVLRGPAAQRARPSVPALPKYEAPPRQMVSSDSDEEDFELSSEIVDCILEMWTIDHTIERKRTDLASSQQRLQQANQRASELKQALEAESTSGEGEGQHAACQSLRFARRSGG